MIGGMLTAIRSFVNEWISSSGNTSELDEIDYGRSKIMLEVAGYCYLAVVVDGESGRSQIANTDAAGDGQRSCRSIAI
jgi:hypothetical protein